MTQLFSVSTTRWSALVRGREAADRSPGDTNLLGEPLPSGMEIDVDYRLDGESFMEDVYSPSTLDAATPLQTHMTPEMVGKYATMYLGVTLSGPELQGFEFLQQTTQALCLYLLGGESVEAWCTEMGLKPIQGAQREPAGRARPRALVIDSPKGKFVLTTRRFSSAKERGLPGTNS